MKTPEHVHTIECGGNFATLTQTANEINIKFSEVTKTPERTHVLTTTPPIETDVTSKFDLTEHRLGNLASWIGGTERALKDHKAKFEERLTYIYSAMDFKRKAIMDNRDEIKELQNKYDSLSWKFNLLTGIVAVGIITSILLFFK